MREIKRLAKVKRKRDRKNVKWASWQGYVFVIFFFNGFNKMFVVSLWSVSFLNLKEITLANHAINSG